MIKNKITSLGTKIVISFVILAIFLLAILFILIVPKMQKEQVDYTTSQIEHMISLTNQQLKLAVKFLIKHSNDQRKEIESNIYYEVDKIQYNIANIQSLERINKIVIKASKNLACKIHILDENKKAIFKTNEDKNIEALKHSLKDKTWHRVLLNKEEMVCPSYAKRILYLEKINKTKNSLVLSCNPKVFHKEEDFEAKVKLDIQKSFSLSNDIHKGKTYLMWIDVKNAKKNIDPLYNKKDNYYNDKYCISKISDVTYPRTGLLTGKDILNAADKAPIKHFLDSDLNKGKFIYPALTWVRSVNNDKKKRLLYITTVYEKDFDNKIDSSFWKILPASLFALFLAIVFGFLLFRKLFKGIFSLALIAKEVNKGNMSLRSNIKGNDDIASLSKAFDNMLDSIQVNFKELDNKVEEKTKELRFSLEEKDVLLKEIHHRVKNNLAMTINLIKLQNAKLSDSKTKTVLKDIQERIFTMELLHRKLYESKDLNSIPIKKYIQELVLDLNSSYEDSKNIVIKTKIDDISLNIDYALPCGLIITELVTNSFKYAFVNGIDGSINIDFSIKNNNCILSVYDNGIGLEKDIDITKCKSLGIRLVTSIIKGQLSGDIEYKYKTGAYFLISFKINK